MVIFSKNFIIKDVWSNWSKNKFLKLERTKPEKHISRYTISVFYVSSSSSMSLSQLCLLPKSIFRIRKFYAKYTQVTWFALEERKKSKKRRQKRFLSDK